MGKKLRTVISVTALAVFLFSAWKLLSRSRQTKQTAKVTESYAAMAVTILPEPQTPAAPQTQTPAEEPEPTPAEPKTEPTVSVPSEDAPPDPEPQTQTQPQTPVQPVPEPEPTPEVPQPASGAPIAVDFDALQAECGSIIAWIYSAGTPLSYPIVQSDDNDYFLRRLPDGQYNYSGSLFMDYRCAADFSDFCSVIYGHNLQHSDTMFGSLLYYQEQWYYNTHPFLYLAVPGQTYRVELICGRETDASSGFYTFPKTAEERTAYVRLLSEGSTFQSSVSFDENDRILLLSTCSYTFNGARYVVAGKLVPVE